MCWKKILGRFPQRTALSNGVCTPGKLHSRVVKRSVQLEAETSSGRVFVTDVNPNEA